VRYNYRWTPLPVKAVGFGKAFFEFRVESGVEFGGAGFAANGINDYDREPVVFDFGIVNLLKDGRDTTRERFGIRKTGVKVSTDGFEFKVVEEIRDKPDERVVLENFAQFGGECAGGAVDVGVVSEEEDVC